MSKRHIGRIATTSAAVSAGAFSLVVLSAGPATAATGDECPRAEDLGSTLDSVTCRVTDLGKAILGGGQKRPSGGGSGTSAQQKQQTSKPRQSAPKGRSESRSGSGDGAESAPRRAAPAKADPPPRPTVPAPKQAPVVDEDPSPAEPLALPAPQVAEQPPSPAPRTRLVAADAPGESDGTTVFWVATAAGLAGAVGALNLSVLSRRRRAVLD